MLNPAKVIIPDATKSIACVSKQICEAANLASELTEMLENYNIMNGIYIEHCDLFCCRNKHDINLIASKCVFIFF